MYFCSGQPMHFCSGVDTSTSWRLVRSTVAMSSAPCSLSDISGWRDGVLYPFARGRRRRRFRFRDIRVRGRPGSSPIGAIAAAPASYRVIAKLRHRKLSAIGPRPRITDVGTRHIRSMAYPLCD
jgi:hypothetical protein